jgi:hypothetical protein
MWVPGQGDQHAKAALQGETKKNYKTVAEDWKNWIRKKQEGISQAEWTSSDNKMVTVKPRIKKEHIGPKQRPTCRSSASIRSGSTLLNPSIK